MEAQVNDEVFDLRSTAPVVRVEEKTAVDTEGILAPVTLGSAGRFAALDDLIVLAARASDGDPCRHGHSLS
jgi:hypothetical protein